MRSTCRRAMVWGIGVVAVLGLGAWWLGAGDRQPLGRAFGALLFYGGLFWLTLLKIWWTAGRPAVSLDGEGLSYQPLHTFRPRRIALADLVVCEPRPGTHSLRCVYDTPRRRRELFLNLGVIDGRHDLLDRLAELLPAAGLAPVAGRAHSWQRPEG